MAYMKVFRLSAVSMISLARLASGARAQADAASAGPRISALKVLDPAYMDTTVRACTDFSRFANGGWLAHDAIPASYPGSGVARDMADRNELVVRSVLDDVMAKRRTLPAGSTQRKLGTFYATCMDSAQAGRGTS
jgi:putative endopeptidase